MDGRLVLLGFIVVLAGVAARDLDPVRPAGAGAAERASELALDDVLLDVDHTQQCYFQRRGRYADTVPSLQFAGGRFMRLALSHDLDIALATHDDGRRYQVRVAGSGIDGVLERDGTELVRLDVGDRDRPAVTDGC
ncbi:MAG TPA: hypothetical protein VFM58_22515 [Solirubrobacteraceae bacterium]|nr:hypothetical protein [Solirubrobacteraceae bacterium]